MTSPNPAGEATGMKTNGEGKFCDWLNHSRSMADVIADRRVEESAARERRRQAAAEAARKTPYAGAER